MNNLGVIKNNTEIMEDNRILQDINKNFEFEKEVGIAIKSKETSS